jgi:hypothetical protein
VSAETLREAARLMREQHGPEHERHEMWSRMADLMTESARTTEVFGTVGQPGSLNYLSLAVARAYLGEAS